MAYKRVVLTFSFIGIICISINAMAGLTDAYLLSIEGDGFEVNNRIKVGQVENVINIEDCDAYQGQRLIFKYTFSIPAENNDYVIKISNLGGTCDDTALTSEKDTNCTQFESGTVKSSDPNYLEIFIPSASITGTDCNTSTDKDVQILFLTKSSGDTTPFAVKTTIRVDLEAPDAPDLTSLAGGNQSITAHWTEVTHDIKIAGKKVTYNVYWSEASFTYETRNSSSVLNTKGIETTSHQITGLDNGKTYYVGTTAVDENDNEGSLSQILSGLPVPSNDFFQHYVASNGGENGGFCFIASAAYGNYNHPFVRILRAFRDRFLLTHAPGQLFVRLYYSFSPPMAKVVEQSGVLRFVTMMSLTPFVAISWFLLVTTLWQKIAVLLLIAILLGALIRKRNKVTQ